MERRPEVYILKADGTNCDAEMNTAFQVAGGDSKVVLLNELRSGAYDLRNGCKILGLPGGFSYGDIPRSGTTQAIKIGAYFPDQVNDFINHGGLVLAACNGFQVLVESGLLPEGKFSSEQTVALTNNQVGHFVCRWGNLRVEKSSRCLFLEGLPDVVNYQVAHGEGRFVAPKEKLAHLEAEELVAFRYCDRLGNQTTDYPENPNGSMNAIAGITDPSGRILGLMPHPERFVRVTHHPNWRRPDGYKTPHGLPLFQAMVRYAQES